MNKNSQKIMTIEAEKLFQFCSKKPGSQNPYNFNTTKRNVYTLVVKQENMMEECPLFYQFLEVLDEKERYGKEPGEQLFDKLIIIDFGNIFMPEKIARLESKKEVLRQNVKDLMENGLDLHFENKDAHMVPFDKSGNMSRNGRITFVDETYLEALNERLNLGMDFGSIPVILSKYYAYRGLYLSSSRRVKNKEFRITPQTLIIIKDERMIIDKNGEEKPITGWPFERNVLKETATEDPKNAGTYIFQKPEEVPVENIIMPYDGEGFITPTYSEYINSSLEFEKATSYQVRLPYAKGMLHEVDICSFLDEYTTGGMGEGEYWYEDAFGIKRDLKKAHLLLTESMFKGKKWLKNFCEGKGIEDPMQYYCDMIEKYDHALYVLSTNLPYGHSKYTRLSYQVINTLDFTEEQFKRITEKHCQFIENPIAYLQGLSDVETEGMTYYIPNWKRAVFENQDFADDIYIRQQLKNTQKGLLTEIANGKIAVEGQTRYLCRDLLPLLSSLLTNYEDINKLYFVYLWQRFYMPMGELENKAGLDYKRYYAFFRNPHLSRNEQCMLRPYTKVDREKHEPVAKVTYEKYIQNVELYEKYFGHLTGIVMLPRGSIAPLCLGGADFDGDLVNVIFDEDVVNAVRRGVYGKTPYERKLSAVFIPSTVEKEETVPRYVPYEHIRNTFFNRIGQISNAAISIGQTEYTQDGESEYDPNKATCAKCTLLTGLEIDAAKNGVHPNLDLILNDSIQTCSYIKFLNAFKKLRAEGEFHYHNLKVTKDQTTVEINAKGCRTVAKFDIPERGTYINKLPVLFAESFKKLKKEKVEKEDFCGFEYSKGQKENQKEIIYAFQEDCRKILNLYFYYKKTYLNIVKNEKNKKFYGDSNLELFLDRMYDDPESVSTNIVMPLRNKLEPYLEKAEAVEAIKKHINECQWQMHPYKKRGEVLEKIIGQGFRESSLTEDEKEFLYHFNQQGYKLLWILITVEDGMKKTEYTVLKDRIVNKHSIPDVGKFMPLNLQLEKVVRAYYENNATNVELILYQNCLKEMKKVIHEAASIMDNSTIVAALYEVTKKERKIFWDAFSWEELEPFIGKKG